MTHTSQFCACCGGRWELISGGRCEMCAMYITEQIRAFVARVNAAAEAELVRTGRIEGAHHRALEAAVAVLGQEVPPPPDTRLALAHHALRELCRWGTPGQGPEGDCWCSGPPGKAVHSPGCVAARRALTAGKE